MFVRALHAIVWGLAAALVVAGGAATVWARLEPDDPLRIALFMTALVAVLVTVIIKPMLAALSRRRARRSR